MLIRPKKFYKTLLANHQSQVILQDPYLLRLLEIPFQIEDLRIHSSWIRYNQEACHFQIERIHCLEVLCFLEMCKGFYKTLLCNRPSGISIHTVFSQKTSQGRQIFHQIAPFLSGRCFALFKRTPMIYAGYVKVAPGKPQAGRVK